MSNKLARVGFLTALSVLLSLSTIVLGAVPFFILRESEGRLSFWVGVTVGAIALAAFQMYPELAIYSLLAILVYSFLEAIELGGGLMRAGLMSIALTSGVGLITIGTWAKTQQIVITEWLRTQLALGLKEVPQLQSIVTKQLDEILVQVPSAIFFIAVLALWLGIMFGQRFSTSRPSSALQAIKLRDFNFPDAAVWLLIVCLPGVFLNKDISVWHICSVNVFNGLVVFYFLRGLAIVASYFKAFNVGLMWQLLFYLLFGTQLFLLVAGFGLADTWLNIRSKLVKKSAETMER